MTTPNTQHIRQLIAEAAQRDAEDQSLARFAAAQVPNLHHTIKLPSDAPEQALTDFIRQYIEHVPDFLDALTALMKEAEFYEQGRVFITIAEEFFISPPGLVSEHTGLVALLDEAYLSHRLVEEVNDRIQIACGTPLSPMDMNLSNIVVHALLGEEFANQLDLAVHYALEALFNQGGPLNSPKCSQYLKDHRDNRWADVLQKWPCLAGDASISLNVEDWLCG